MMKKFIFANAALLALSISGAWADAVQTIDNLGVRYTLGTPQTTPGTPSSTGTITCNGNDVASTGVISITGTETTTQTTALDYDVTPTTFIGTSVTFGSWSESNQVITETNTGNSTEECLPGTTEYQNAVKNAKRHGLTLYSWEEAKTDQNVNKFFAFKNVYNEDEEEWNLNKETYNTAAEFETAYTSAEANKFYFYQKTLKSGKNSYYAISKISNSSNEVKDSTTVSNYNYTTIPADLAMVDDYTQPTAITINADITTIEEGAFHFCTSVNNIVCEDPDRFSFTSPILYSWKFNETSQCWEATVLYVTPNVTNTEVTLDGDVVRVGDWATINISKGVYIYYNNPTMEVEKSRQSAYFTWISADGDIETHYNSDKKCYTVLAGSPLKQETVDNAIASCLGSGNEVLYIDFRDGIITEDFTIDANHENTLFLFSTTDRNIGGVNVVRNTNTGFICDSLSLEDAYSNKAFFSPVSFDVAKATYDRQFTEGFYSSVCLPFEFKSIPEGFTVGHMSSYEASTNTFVFEENKNNMSAYKPYIVVSENGNQAFPTLDNVTVAKTTTITNESSNGATFIGTISPVVLTGGADSYMYYGFSNKTGKLAHVGENKSTTVKSFRAYFKAPATNYQTGSAAEIRFEYENGEVSAITSIEETQNDDNVIYNLNGQRVNDMKAAGIYVKNGKTIMVK